MDVKDDTPLMISPSSSHLASPVHNRSIVVLTPNQAIKFTAISHERHISWLTALNFLVHNDPADLVIPRGISASPSNGSLWPREPVYPPSATASSITSYTTQHQYPGSKPSSSHTYGSYTVRKNSLPEFVPIHHPRDEMSPLGHKHRLEEYAIPPSVPRIPTGRRFESRERSGSGSGSKDWEDPNWPGNNQTIRMDAFVKRSPPRHDGFIDDNLFREF